MKIFFGILPKIINKISCRKRPVIQPEPTKPVRLPLGSELFELLLTTTKKWTLCFEPRTFKVYRHEEHLTMIQEKLMYQTLC